jgi:ribosomal protein S18 acetylase RimI-like enzyme
MAADLPVSHDSTEASGEFRRLEERALNASGAFQSLVYDGWLLGYRPGPTKRLRCVNPLYRSTLPLAEKVAYCVAFYAAANLPPIFRLVPFSQPSALDGWLERNHWKLFDRTLVLRTELAEALRPATPDIAVDLVEPPAWEPLAAELLGIPADALPRYIERASSYPLPHAGALVRRDGEVVACGLVKLEGDHAGIFAVHTAKAWRGRGLGRAIVAALLAEAQKRGAARAYLQVTADNAPALALYDRFGFATAYAYWYRSCRVERA